VFGYHKSVLKSTKERLEKAGVRVGIVTGDVSPNKRQAIIDSFQNGELDVIIGNIIAMGVGYTLTRACFVVFVELDWVPSMIEQAEDRAWRHGQLNAVIIQHLVVDGSIEARMAIAILEKMGVIGVALDGARELEK
jgi:SWI/SNF-related matrix-associated actin-dependent regulator 1 of chromatin subfamily A